MHGIFWMVIDHSVHATVVLSPHGNARCFLGGNRPLWYMLPWYSAPTVMHGIVWMVIDHSCTHFTAVFSHHGNVWYILRYFIFFWVTLACVWCCYASKFTQHENHQTTSNLNMKYSGEHNNKRHVQITGRHSQPTGNDKQFFFKKKRYAPRCQLLHHQIKAVKEPSSPFLTNYGIVRYNVVTWTHKSTAASSAKLQQLFETFNNYYVHHKIKDDSCAGRSAR